MVRCIGIDLKLGALGGSGGIKTLPKDAVGTAVLKIGRPCRDEAAIRQIADGWRSLIDRRMGVDLKLISLRCPCRIIALAKGAIAAAIVAEG